MGTPLLIVISIATKMIHQAILAFCFALLIQSIDCTPKEESPALNKTWYPKQNTFPLHNKSILPKSGVLNSNLFPRGDCFERDINYNGQNINDGLMLLTASASECQANCKVNAQCNAFTWTDPDSFPDPIYHNSCWMKKSIGNKNSQTGAVSGPKACDEPNSCCNTLTFKSTGSLADGGQSHVLGQYDYVDEGDDGTKVYHQDGHGGGDPEVYLYYKGGLFNQWFISEIVGYNGGYAWISDDNQCPETLDHRWEWYDWSSDSMIEDTTAEMVCGDPGPDPTDPPPPPNNCCNELVFESTGGISDSIQKHVLGNYDYHSDGEVGTKIYKHTDRGDYLYYLEWLGLWYIGSNPGENAGFADNEDDRKCPEQLAKTWEWTDGEDWILDDVANMRCR